MSLESLAKVAADLPGETPEERWALLVQNKLIEAGEPPFVEPWWEILRTFWRSGKRVLAVAGANRAGKTTHINGMCAMPQMMFRHREPFADSDLVWPNASATIDLANLSLRSAAAICRAVGFTEVKGRSKDLAKRLEPMTIFASEGNKNSPGTIEFLDVCNNRVEFRSSASTAMGLSGFTGTGGTADEVELKGWGTPQEAREAIGLMKSRLRGQRGTHIHLISRLFAEDGVLAKICKGGDNEGLMVARLGKRGAEYDERARRHLKRYLEGRAQQGDRAARRYSQDKRLIEAADPNSHILPGWSLLPIGEDREPGPEAAILSCWALAVDGTDLDEGEIPIDGLLRVYGGRPTGHEGQGWIDRPLLKEARERDISGLPFVRRAAALDPGTSINSCALAIGEERGGYWRPLVLKEWRGAPGKPLDIRNVVGPEAAAIVKSYGITDWLTDAHEWAAVQLVSVEYGLGVRQDSEELATSFGPAKKVHNGERAALRRADDPELDELCGQLAEELGAITEKRREGKTSIALPLVGARHADLARAWIRMLWHAKAGGDREGATGLSTASASDESAWYPDARY